MSLFVSKIGGNVDIMRLIREYVKIDPLLNSCIEMYEMKKYLGLYKLTSQGVKEFVHNKEYRDSLDLEFKQKLSISGIGS